jgi:hypothetical protein
MWESACSANAPSSVAIRLPIIIFSIIISTITISHCAL